jgi:hypothetical protein
MSNAIKGIVDTTETLRGNLNAEGTLSGNLNAARGFDGESAYDVAVKNGFEGTEQEWLTSLKGEKGEQGEQGIGIQGEKGEKGDTGNSGVYLGSGDMPDDCNVQIDPDGDVVTVEQLIEEITTKSATKTADGTVVSQNADFAEVAEWADGNPNNEDRTGYFVCANVPVNGIVMKKATSIDDVKGVTILAPAFAGNYTKDKVDSNGNLLPKYSYVAIIGFVPVIDNGTCTVGGRCMPDDNGCAIPSSNSMGYQVVNRIDENRVLIIIEPNGDMVQRVKTKINQLQDDVNNRVANALKGNKSGTDIISINDTSPIEHDVKCTLWADAVGNYTSFKVKRLGKNLVNSTDFNVNRSITITLENPLPKGTYVFSGIFTTTASSGYVQFGYTDGSYSSGGGIDFTYKSIEGTIQSFKVSLPKPLKLINIYASWSYNASAGHTAKFVNFMIEKGSTATEYEPYIEPIEYTANADGTVEGIKSLYPATTLMTDTEGVNISAEYNRDINKAFAALEAAIANL